MVVLKADGLPGWLVERMLSEREDGVQLPWIERVFVERGVWVRNFYSRGVSLSVPAWSILDTGRPMVIRGNVEYDRYTLRAFDYLNFVPFYFKAAFSKAADMPAVEALDDLGVELLSDRFEQRATRQSFQLFQRDIPWKTLRRAAGAPFPPLSPRRLIGELESGLELPRALQDEMERALIRNLDDERIRYLDLYMGEFDHVAHLDNSEEAQRKVVRELDALVGRVWSAIQESPLGDSTLLALVSDHGMNTNPEVYSQGYNLVELFRSAIGGGHHVVTNRHPMADYKLKGLYPFVHKVLTSSDASPYAKSAPKRYPTVLLDLDGNERAAVYLRNSELNKIHLLLLELERKDLAPELRKAAEAACRQAIADYAARSRPRLGRLAPRLDALQARIAKLRSNLPAIEGGIEHRRAKARLRSWKVDEEEHREAIAAMDRLFAATPGRRGASKLVPERHLGEPNSIGQLQHYVVSVAPGGLKLGPGGVLDEARSFRRIDYFDLLRDLTVRNVVQEGVGRRPVDFLAAAVPAEALAAALPAEDAADAAVWLHGGDGRQLLILARGAPPEVKILPVASLRQGDDGRIAIERRAWGAGLPLGLIEDEELAVAEAERKQWLGHWRSERDWLRASHRTRYANAVVGLLEQFRPLSAERGPESFHHARRGLLQPDLLVLASDHWNFNVRGFNPGGNHGGFFRASSHSVLMLAGGEATGARRGVAVDEPYDALSFVPTLIGLMGSCDPDLPGVPIQEAGESLEECSSAGGADSPARGDSTHGAGLEPLGAERPYEPQVR